MSLELSGTTPAIKGVAGSVSAPAITGDDADTGISFPSANTIKFSTNGVERISITDAGISGTGISAGGKFASYAIIADRKTQNTNGGTITAGAFRTRDLNTEIADADGIVSISSNQFTLQAGSYKLVAYVPVVDASDRGAIRLYNVTDSSVTENGESIFQGANMNVTYRIFSRFTISAAKVFEIQDRRTGTYNTYGGGVAGNFHTETYTVVEIFKES